MDVDYTALQERKRACIKASYLDAMVPDLRFGVFQQSSNPKLRYCMLDCDLSDINSFRSRLELIFADKLRDIPALFISEVSAISLNVAQADV